MPELKITEVYDDSDRDINSTDIQTYVINAPVTRSYYYDPYGGQWNEDNGYDTNPFRYAGEQWDRETGSIYLRARFYSPGTGRFMTVDPIKDGENWYAYCAGNPVMFRDPSGMVVLKILNYDSLSKRQQLMVRAAAWFRRNDKMSQQEYENALDKCGAKYNSAIVNSDPAKWNKQETISAVNCYAYALNMDNPPDNTRIDLTGDNQYLTSSYEYNDELIKVFADNAKENNYTFVNVNDVECQPDGTWMVLLVAKINGDYHWFKMDASCSANECWSHKRGYDMGVEHVEDPLKTAKELGYTNVLGWFYVGPNDDTTQLK